MSEPGHLPECPFSYPRQGEHGGWYTDGPCACGMLRACEARVREEYSAEIEAQGAQWEASCRQYYRSGSDDGKSLALDAARDAVAAVHVWNEGQVAIRVEALAAIDALRATP